MKRWCCEIVFLLLLTISFSIFFIDKAFNIDDNVFFIRAKQRYLFPARPYCLPDLYDGKINFSIYRCTHPPFIPIYLFTIMKLTGKMDEATLHAGFLAFPILSTLFIYLLGHLVIKNGFLPALMLITSPTFMIMSTNIMTDVAMLAFCLATIYLFLLGTKKRNTACLCLSSTFHILALFTSYQSIFVTFLLLLFLLSASEMRVYPCLSILIPIISFGLWCVISKSNFGVFQFAVAADYLYHDHNIFNVNFMLIKFIYYLSMLGFLSIPPYLIIYLAWKERRGLKIFLILFLLISISFSLFLKVADVDYTLFQKLCISFLSAISVLMLYKTIRYTTTDKSIYNSFMIMWSIGFFVFANLIFSFGAARYLLPMFPPLAIAFSRYIISHKSGIVNVAIVFSLLNVLMGLTLAHSDYVFAYQYKKVAEDIRREYAQVNRIWFSGEMNFRHYIERIGGLYLLSNDTSPVQGDILVMSKKMSCNSVNKDLLKRISHTKDIYLNGDYIQIFNTDLKAGFYSHWNGSGLLPFVICRNKNFDKITIYSVGDKED